MSKANINWDLSDAKAGLIVFNTRDGGTRYYAFPQMEGLMILAGADPAELHGTRTTAPNSVADTVADTVGDVGEAVGDVLSDAEIILGPL